MNDRRSQLGLFWLVAAFIVAVVPMEAAVVYAVWQLGRWTFPLLLVACAFLMYGVPASRDYLDRSGFRSRKSIRAAAGIPLDTSIPPPPLLPRDMLPAPANDVRGFEHEARKKLSSIPPAIN